MSQFIKIGSQLVNTRYIKTISRVPPSFRMPHHRVKFSLHSNHGRSSFEIEDTIYEEYISAGDAVDAIYQYEDLLKRISNPATKDLNDK